MPLFDFEDKKMPEKANGSGKIVKARKEGEEAEVRAVGLGPQRYCHHRFSALLENPSGRSRARAEAALDGAIWSKDGDGRVGIFYEDIVCGDGRKLARVEAAIRGLAPAVVAGGLWLRADLLEGEPILEILAPKR